jgi:hypothetical protein
MAWGDFVHGRWILVLATAMALGDTHAAAADPRATLVWDANSEPDVAGYRVYYGTSSRTYPFVLDARNVTSLPVPTLNEGTYYFALTAYNTAGLESDYSDEVTHTVSLRTATTATLVSSINPARPGEAVSFTFTVRAAVPVTNILSGLAIFQIGEAVNLVPLGGGVATFATTLPAGAHTVTAGYGGDANFLGVTNRLNPDQVINTPPVARADQINRILPNGAKIQVSNLLTNDWDADGHGLTLTWVAPQSASGASVTRRSSWVYYVAPEEIASADSFTYRARDELGAEVTGTVDVRIADPQATPNVAVSEDGGSYRIRFDATPNVTYRIEFAETDLSNWQPLATRTADEFGIIEMTDTPPSGLPPRTYRSVTVH